MPTPTDAVGFKRQVHEIAEQVNGAKPLAKAEVADLITAFGDYRTNPDTFQWLQQEYPDLYLWLKRIPEDVYVRGARDPQGLAKAAQTFIQTANAEAKRLLWDDLGLPIAYEERARAVHPDKNWQFLQVLSDKHGKEGPRFVMPETQYRAFLPTETRSAWERLTHRDLADDVARRLVQLSVPKDEVDVGQHEVVRAWAMDISCLHVPALDGALLLDALNLEQRGKLLCADPNWTLVQRMTLPGASAAENCFVMPVADFMKLRGVRYGLPADASTEQIVAQCTARLASRGEVGAQLHVVKQHGVEALALSAEAARLLLAPVAAGDPACAYSVRPQTLHDPAVIGYCAENAVLCAQAANLVYEDPPTVEKYLGIWGFTEPKFIANASTDAQAFVAYDANKNMALVAFRGTESRADVLADADATLIPRAEYGGAVHRGFATQLDSIAQQIDTAVQALQEHAPAGFRVMVTGHSLGGALAVLYAAGALKAGLPVVSTYTFGQPAVGDRPFAERFKAQLEHSNSTLVRFVNNSDIFPHVPPNCEHGVAGEVMILDRFGALHRAKEALFKLPAMLSNLWDGAERFMREGDFQGVSNPVEDHRSANYLGLTRKNRDVTFDADGHPIQPTNN